MSKQYYNLKWKEAIDDLFEQCALEFLPQDQNEQTLGKNYKRSDYEWFHFHANLYIKYVEIYKKLEDCFDQIVHPQKRTLLREMLENTMVRIVEEKIQLVKYNTGPPDKPHCAPRSDFVNLDELIMDLKLTPDCIDIPIPRYFREEEKRRLDERNFMIDELLLEHHDTKEPEVEEWEERPIINEQEEDQAKKMAFMIVIRNELGRFGIEEGYEIKKKIRKDEIKKRQIYENIDETIEKAQAMMVIKKYWRATMDRFKVQQMREKELLFLGIKVDENVLEQIEEDEHDIFKFIQNRYTDESEPKKQYDKMMHQRKALKFDQNTNDREFKEALNDLKNHVRDNEGANFREHMLKERRDWMYKCVEQSEFNEVPAKAEDFYERDKTLDIETFDKKAAQLEEEAKKKGAAAKKDSKGKGGAKKSELDEFLEANKPVGPTEAFQKLQKKIEEFKEVWNQDDVGNRDGENFEQKHDIDLAKKVVRPSVQEEIKGIVDEMIDIELDNLRLALNKKKGKKKTKKTKVKKPRKKKFPGDNVNKSKDPKDLLAGLIDKGIVKKLPPALLADLKGEPNVLGAHMEREAAIMPDPSMLQIRQCIAEYIGIPLGSQYAREKILDCMSRERFDKNNQLNFFLFYGPHGSGKTLAVRALAHECNAIVIDISPSNLEGKYQEKNQYPVCINAAFRVAQEFQPAIIYCEDIEMIFQGKKKKGVTLNTTFAKMKKPLQDFKKGKFLNPEDRVAFIACSSHPYDGSAKDMKIFFDKKFYFPFPNYSTRKMLLEYFMSLKDIKIPPNFSINTLAHASMGYTPGSMRMAIDKVLSEKRVQELKKDVVINHLKVAEFIGPLSQCQYSYPGDYKSFLAFTDDVCQFKERREKNNKEGEDKNDKKDKKKGGKK